MERSANSLAVHVLFASGGVTEATLAQPTELHLHLKYKMMPVMFHTRKVRRSSSWTDGGVAGALTLI